MSSISCEFVTFEYSEEEWTNLTSESADSNLLQTWAYGEAKAATGNWKVVRGTIVTANRAIGAAQVLIRRLPIFNGGLAWLNRGPILFPSKGERITLMAHALKAVRAYFVDQEHLYLRVAPPFLADEVNTEFLAQTTLMNTGILGWASTRLDLKPPESVLRTGLNRKWRGHLNKAEKSKLNVQFGDDDKSFATFYRLYSKMLAEKKLTTNLTGDFFSTLQNILPVKQKMLAFVCKDGDEELGAILIARYGCSGEYLAAATTSRGREKNAGQLLLWRVIRELKARGYLFLDLSGVDPWLTPKGILTFKQGVGGQPYRLAPELDALPAGIIGTTLRWWVQRKRLRGL